MNTQEELKITLWQGKVTAKLPNSTTDQIWPLLSDYFNIHKWLPGVDTCTLVEGLPGQPGCIRHCSGTIVPCADGVEEIISWVYEKLVAIDPVKKCFTYEILDNNMGFKSYVATMGLLELDDENAKKGCEIEWSILSHPIDGQKLEDFIALLDSCLCVMAKRMEEALQAGK